MPTLVHAVDKPNLPPFTMPDRFRQDINYFMGTPRIASRPELPEGEYWVCLEETRRCLEEGVIRVVSPLDSENQTEFEITEDQEEWLEWMIANEIEHVRLA